MYHFQEIIIKESKYKKEIGALGEKIATNYLERNSYKIIERNFSCRQGEVDIIARDEKEIVFIEVKTRTNINFGIPSEAVNFIKQTHLYKTAQYFLYKNECLNKFIRFDVIEIIINNGKISLNHIKQIM